MNKYKIITISTIIIILAGLFIFKTTQNKTSNISITNIPLSKNIYGYIKEAKTENAFYYFSDEDEKTNIKLASELEDLFKKVHVKFGLKLNIPMKIYFTSDINENKKNTSLTVVINKNSYLTGTFLDTVTQFKLPAWLNIGIELNLININKTKIKNLSNKKISTWINNAKNENLPSFSDFWFIPNLIDNPLNKDVSNISYTFVNYLEKKQILDKVVSLYLKDNKEEAETIVKQEWANFTKSDSKEIDLSCKFSFFHNDVRFQIYTDKVEYKFYKNQWTYEDIAFYIDYLKRSVNYVEQWFGHELKEKVECKIYDTIGYATGRRQIIELRRGEMGIFAMPHEITHTITQQLEVDYDSQFTPFGEGLANVIMYSLNEELQNAKINNLYIENITELNNDVNKSIQYNFMENYKKFSKNAIDIVDSNDIFDYYAYSMAAALYDFKDENYNESKGSFTSYNSRSSDYKSDLNGYDKSTSFVFYLIKKYGKDKFMEVYYNPDIFKDIYGIEIQEMLEEWKSFLGIK